jgi:drug/metabolite transporter (DMT)-like permease
VNGAPDRPVAATLVATTFAMVAFAANSVLCRLALGEGSADAAGFTVLRLVSGAAALALLTTARRRPRTTTRARPPWISGAFLFLYAAGFSFAYVTLSAGTGALLLFGAVQTTMIVAALLAGERFGAAEGIGLVAALAGLAVLVAPGVTAPSLHGSVLMLAAGIAWGFYSLRGRGSIDAMRDTARNFAVTVPMAVLLGLGFFPMLRMSAGAALLAVISGAVTSGLGYVIWYAALRGLTSVRAAIVQLSVPALAALGGAIFLHETVTLRLLLSGVMILGGVGIAVLHRARPAPSTTDP